MVERSSVTHNIARGWFVGPEKKAQRTTAATTTATTATTATTVATATLF